MRKTKIVCTLGPASADEKVMEAMLRAGMNVARFNFSHGTHESHREMMQRFRAVRDRLGVAAAVMLDTKGPEIRLKDMAGGETMLADGAEFTLTARDVQGDAAQVSITYAELPREVKAGDRGVAVSRLAPMGKVEIGGRTYEAKSQGAYVDQQRDVEVVGFENFSVIVKTIK